MRIIKLVAIILIFISSGILSGQTDKLNSIHSIKATIIGLTYSYDLVIFDPVTINFEFTVGGGLASNWKAGNNWLIVPSVRLEPRYYYNFYKRSLDNKIVTNNSSDFFSLSADYQFNVNTGGNPNHEEFFSLIPKWGLRRSVGYHFFYEGEAGAGIYLAATENFKPLIGLDLKFGYAF